jgi:hypothetical protein
MKLSVDNFKLLCLPGLTVLISCESMSPEEKQGKDEPLTV